MLKQLLTDALRLIEEDGWFANPWNHPRGDSNAPTLKFPGTKGETREAVCAWLAVDYARARLPFPLSTEEEAAQAILETLARPITAETAVQELIFWNNEQTSPEPVLAAFRATIARLA